MLSDNGTPVDRCVGGDVSLTVSTLLCHRDTRMALACLGSLVRHSDVPVQIQIHDDGSLTQADVEALTQALPVARVISRAESDARMAELLAPFPRCREFRKAQVYGLKLFDAALMAPGGVLRFVDSDIYFLRAFTGLFSADADAACTFMADRRNAYAFRPWHLIGGRVEVPVRLNCGLFEISSEHYSLEAIEGLMDRYEALFSSRYHWAEQTSWAVLAMRARGNLWSEDQVRVISADDRSFDGLVAAHVVTPARARLADLYGYDQAQTEPVVVEAHPLERLTSVSLLREQGMRRATRMRERWQLAGAPV
ncbi:hypothetical protein [Demequina mangrovi]|nr:hypothetical protein [Demequina mangrovi]